MSVNPAGASQGASRFWTVMLAATLILIAASVAGCSKKVARTPEPRPVRTVTVEAQADGETVSFTGQIRARDQVNLAFRLDGRRSGRDDHRCRPTRLDRDARRRQARARTASRPALGQRIAEAGDARSLHRDRSAVREDLAARFA